MAKIAIITISLYAKIIIHINNTELIKGEGGSFSS